MGVVDYLKKCLRSKTMVFGAAVVVLTNIEAVAFEMPLPWWGQSLIGTALGLGVMYLRAVTTNAISEK